MNDFIEDTPAGIYRLTPEGKIYSQSKLKIPLVSKGRKHVGNFKLILKKERLLKLIVNP